MSIVWMDGFEHYDAVQTGDFPLDTNYSGSNHSLISLGTGRLDGKALTVTSSSIITVSRGVPNVTTMTVGVAIKLGALPSARTVLLDLTAADGGSRSAVVITASGAIGIITGNSTSTTPFLQTADGLITAGNWNYIEVTITAATSATGSASISINGLSVATISSVQTASSGTVYGIVSVRLSNSACDDFYVTNDSTKLGPVHMTLQAASADTTQADWTPSTGTSHFACVDTVPVDTTTYVSASAASKYDLYALGDLSGTPASIKAVAPLVVAKKDDSGLRTLRTKMKSGTTTSNGAEFPLNTGYAQIMDVYTQNPDTSAAWTASDVNALQVGLEIVQ